MKQTQWPPLSKRLVDREMPIAQIQVCSAQAKFWMGTMEQSMAHLSKNIHVFWKETKNQNGLNRDLVRLLYCACAIGQCARIENKFSDFFDWPKKYIQLKVTKGIAARLKKVMVAIEDEARAVAYNTVLIRPEYLLLSDDDERGPHQKLQEDIDRHFSALHKALNKLRDLLESFASPAKGRAD